MTAFRPISWQPNDAITDDLMNQMVENDQYLFENTANMAYRDATGVRTTTGLKLIAGVGIMPIGFPQAGAHINVSYAGEFDSGIYPIITTGIVPTHPNEHVCTLGLIGLGSALPTDNGFQFRMEGPPGAMIVGNVYCHYMALGVSSRVSAAPE